MKGPIHESSATARTNPGETLRNAREAKGWSLGAVAQQLNLSERSLSQIEAGDFSQMPGHTFARGYVRAYAKLLELDQNRLVTEFDQYTGTDATGAAVHSLGRIEEPVRLSHSVLRFFTFVLLVVLAGAGFLWWQDQPVRDDTETTSIEHIEVEGADGTTQIHALDLPEDQAVLDAQGETLTPPLVEVPSAVEDQPANALDGQAEQGDDSAAAPDAAPAPTSEAAPTVEAPVPSELTPTAEGQPLVEPTVSPAEAPPAAADGSAARLTMQFEADCWVRIVDATGEVLLGRLVRAGASHEVSGEPPLSVHLGYARGVALRFNGEPVDVAPFLRGETARFTLGQ